MASPFGILHLYKYCKLEQQFTALALESALSSTFSFFQNNPSNELINKVAIKVSIGSGQQENRKNGRQGLG